MDYRTKVSIRDFIFFVVKLWVDGMKDAAMIVLSSIAFGLDLVFKLHGGQRYFPRLMRASERFDSWLNLHGAIEDLDGVDDELFDSSKAGSDRLLAEIEKLTRGRNEPPSEGPPESPHSPSP